MKRILSATILSAALTVAYPGGATAQQPSYDDTANEGERNEPPAPESYRSEERPTPEPYRSPGELPPAGNEASQSVPHGSGLAPKPHKVTMRIRIEQVPRPIAEEVAARLVGKSVVSRRGVEVGEIFAVVRSPTNRLHALVDVGEFFGVGVRPVALPIEPGGIDRNGNLRVQLSRDELHRIERYDPQMYQ